MLRPSRAAGWWALLALLPWAWFLVRDVHPLLEWGAILLPILVGASVLGVLLLAAVLRSRRLLEVAAVWLAFGLVAVLVPWTPRSTGAPTASFVLATANVLSGNTRTQALTRDLLDLDADVLVVSELGLSAAVVDALDVAYPHAVQRPDGAVRVWSRFPATARPLPSQGPLRHSRGLRVVLRAPAGPVALYALHLQPPSPAGRFPKVTVGEQRDLVAALDRQAEADPLPVLLAGDLNATSRGAAYRRLAEGRVDAGRASWAGPTSLRRRNLPLLLRIDHLLLPSDWCAADARRQQLTGSDHRAVVARVGPCP